MFSTNLGDQARLLSNTRLTVALRQELAARTSEMASGRHADVGAVLGGDHARLSRLEAARSVAQAHLQASRSASVVLDASQVAVGTMRDTLQSLRGTLHISVQSGTATTLAQTRDTATSAFVAAVGTLNTTAAGRSLFAGIQSDGAALAPAQTMLAALRTELGSASTAEDAITTIEAWFAPGGGFDGIGHLGGAPAGVPTRLGAGIEVAPVPTAADPAFRVMLSALAMAALSGDGPGAGDTATMRQMQAQAAQRSADAGDGLIRSAAAMGEAQALVDRARTGAQAELSSLEMARTALLEADPFDTAVRLQDTMRRLEALFSVTARSARLTLTGHL